MHGLYNISSFSTTDLMGMGNIRVMFAQTGKVLQDQSYYPFGMTMGSSLTFQVKDQLPDNKYKYNGNPDGDRGQDDFGLNWYDYGARMYDPTIGRWNGIDAHAENYFSLSSYNYGLNNPIRMIDPDGMDARLYDIDEWNAFSMDEYGNITLYGSSSGQGNNKTKGKTSNKGNDKKDDNSENNPNQGDPVKDHLLDVAAGNAPGNTFGVRAINGDYKKGGANLKDSQASYALMPIRKSASDQSYLQIAISGAARPPLGVFMLLVAVYEYYHPSGWNSGRAWEEKQNKDSDDQARELGLLHQKFVSDHGGKRNIFGDDPDGSWKAPIGALGQTYIIFKMFQAYIDYVTKLQESTVPRPVKVNDEPLQIGPQE